MKPSLLFYLSRLPFNDRDMPPSMRLLHLWHWDFFMRNKLFGFNDQKVLVRFEEHLFGLRGKRNGKEEKILIAFKKFKEKLFSIYYDKNEDLDFSFVDNLSLFDKDSNTETLENYTIELPSLRARLIYEEQLSFIDFTPFDLEDRAKSQLYFKEKYPQSKNSDFSRLFEQLFGDKFYVHEASDISKKKGLSNAILEAISFSVSKGRTDVAKVIRERYSKYII